MAEKNKKNFLQRIAQYFKDVRVELGKVSWPNRQEVVALTIVVIVVVAFFSLYVGALDFLFSALVKIVSQK